jgi:hypothetical protein
MGLRATILGWLRQDTAVAGDLRAAEANEVDREYADEQADAVAELRLGATPDEFEADQRAPDH